MAAKDRLFAQFTMLNYLQGSRDRTVQEILDHLQHNTRWGRQQLGHRGPGDVGMRNVQNWLKEIRDSEEFQTQISYRRDPDDARKILYSSTAPTVGARILPIEEACLILMAEKFLQAAIPADFMDSGLQELFRAARKRLEEYDAIPKQHRKRIKDYLNRIAIEQRGQTLVEHEVPYDVLAPLSRAILEGKRIDCRYRGKRRELHPFAIVLKSPKVYLLAADDHRIRKSRPENVRPAQFLCVRMTDVSVSDRPNLVPDSFNAEKYIAQRGLDVEAHDVGDLPAGGFKLVLRLFDADKDNLLADLEEFPLSASQEIAPEKGTGNYLLEARRMRATRQLIEWIVGRLDRVEVVAPQSLRAHVVSTVDAMRARYT